MTYINSVTFVSVAVVCLVCVSRASAASRSKAVIYTSECSCENDHGVARWRAKTDRSEPPANRQYIQPITPSEIFNWQGPGVVPRGGARMGVETRWFALTGRIVTLQVEADGDVHMVLTDATGNQPGKVIAEIPLGDRWCKLRTAAFLWTNVVFPFELTRDEYPFDLVRRPVVTVVGKAFYDTDHSGKDYRNNRRPRAKDKAVWEIHPVMDMVVQDSPPASQPTATPTATVAAPASVSRSVSMPLASSTPPPTVSVQFVVTLTKPVTVKIPYGETTLPAGRQLTAISHDDKNVIVLFEGRRYSIPITSTDIK